MMGDTINNLKTILNLRSNFVDGLSSFSHLIKNMLSCDQEIEIWSSSSSSSSMMTIDPINYWKNHLHSTLINFKNCLFNCGLKNVNLIRELELLESELIELLNCSTSYSACGIAINGFTSFVDNVIDFFIYVIKYEYTKSGENVQEIKIIIELFRSIAQLLINGHHERCKSNPTFDEIIKSNSNQLGLVRKDFIEMKRIIDIREKYATNLDILLTKFFAFYFDNATKPWIDINIRLLVFSFQPFPACFKVFNDEHVYSLFRKMCKTASSVTPLKALSFYDSFFAKSALNLLTYNSRTIVQTIWIDGYANWLLSKHNSDIIDNRHHRHKYQLRCRLITHANKVNKHGIVIFFCHGGGMILLSPEFHEVSKQLTMSLSICNGDFHLCN